MTWVSLRHTACAYYFESHPMSADPSPPTPLSRAGRAAVLAVAFLGWLGAGVHMSITQQCGRAASIDLLGRTGEIDAERFAALNKRQEAAKKGYVPPLSQTDAAQAKAWEESVGR